MVLFGSQLIRPAPPPAVCPAPGELRAEEGHSVELACATPVAGRPVRGPARRLVGLPIDPNTADAATLETLPGVGPARAFAILEAREHRPFQRVADLERVPGIGPRTLAGMAAALAIGEPSAPAGDRQAERAARRSRAEAEAPALPAPYPPDLAPAASTR
jgi:competence protein ComEA